MKEKIAENCAFESFHEEEEPNRLSFCNLPMEENYSVSPQRSPRNSSTYLDEQLFEFFAGTAAVSAAHKDIIFCGKIIHEEEKEDELNEYQKRDYFATTKSQSVFRSTSSVHDSTAAKKRQLSASSKISGGDLDYHAQSVNITSLTSMSAKSRRRMFMFGPVKFKPEMDMSAIKKRQSRRATAKDTAEKKKAGGESQCGVLRSRLKGRLHLTNMLARSFGCFPVAGGGGGRLVGVAN